MLGHGLVLPCIVFYGVLPRGETGYMQTSLLVYRQMPLWIFTDLGVWNLLIRRKSIKNTLLHMSLQFPRVAKPQAHTMHLTKVVLELTKCL